MRYLLVMAALGENMARRLIDLGVSADAAQSWMSVWNATLTNLEEARPGTYLAFGYTFAGHLYEHRQLLLTLTDGSKDEQS